MHQPQQGVRSVNKLLVLPVCPSYEVILIPSTNLGLAQQHPWDLCLGGGGADGGGIKQQVVCDI